MHHTSNKVKSNLLLALVLIIFSSSIQANKLVCNSYDVDKFIESENIILFDVHTPKSRSWVKNYLSALKDKSVDILEKYKKTFSANIKVQFDNGLVCVFPSKIRISGDHKDHLDGAATISSLDVKLLAGNINSTIKFKLFIPHTKGGVNEVFSTALLKELGFLAPKTYLIPAVFNGQKTTFLFQEKISKEFIESNNLREAPILEGDERFLFANDLIGFDRFGLSRIINNKWSENGLISLNISKKALSKLNKAYLKYLSGMHIDKSASYRFLSPNASSIENISNKNREFEAIMVAMGAMHGLRPHNRSFYYDPFYRYFRPIYYDGNSGITNLNTYDKDFIIKALNWLTRNESIGSSFAIESINELNRKHFHSQLENLGLSFSLNEVNEILDTIIKNLHTMKNTNLVNPENKNSYSPYFSNFKDLTKDENNRKLVFPLETELNIEICDLLLISCYDEILTIKDYSKMLSSEYSDESENSYIFIGNKQAYLTGLISQSQKVERMFDLEDGAQLVVYGLSKVVIDKKEKKIELIQINNSDRFLIKGGELKNWSIRLIGLTDEKINKKQRFNQDLLTGCLTLLDLSIANISIEIDDALCEDGVNLIRVNGGLNSVVVKNALSDAIDADFSNLNFKSIVIKDAGNDCIDLSSGDYQIDYADLSDCKDKAVSAGEQSKLSINSVKISNSNIGVASKDSSVVEINSTNINLTATCFSAYNKKQEFWGGKIIVKKHNCLPNQVNQQKNSLVEFVE